MLTLANACLMIDAALAEGRRLSLSPLVVAVLDAGAHLLAFKREDGAGIARFDIAFAKAAGSLGMGFGSRELTERATKNPTFILALTSLTAGRMAPSPGGVLVLDASRRIIGAVGVSGDIGDKDELCAIAGIHVAAFGAAPGIVT